MGSLGWSAVVVAEVRVELKPGVADPEGSNTRKALELLGFTQVVGVRSIRVFELELKEPNKQTARKAVETMCERLLANPVIHRYTITVR